ncbi:hypothetical protein LIER_37842 [Lithospermum erythrorhizon]|uniref:Uncharacterized protein n=1 Tax=Lithospermum erythrorhizon TaxID=34254 RepID=A0AAV3PRC0_LITER
MIVMAVMIPGMSFGGAGTKARGGARAGKAMEETNEKTTFYLKLEEGLRLRQKSRLLRRSSKKVLLYCIVVHLQSVCIEPQHALRVGGRLNILNNDC